MYDKIEEWKGQLFKDSISCVQIVIRMSLNAEEGDVMVDNPVPLGGDDDTISIKSKDSPAIKEPKGIVNHPSKSMRYVPMAIASEKISKMSKDMKAMKDKHIDIVNEIGDNYRQIREETQEYFEKFIDELKNKRKAEKDALSKVIKGLQNDLKNGEAESSKRLASSEDKYKEALAENKRLVKQYEDDVDKLKKEHESSMEATIAQHKSEASNARGISDELEKARHDITLLQKQLEEKSMLVNEQRALSKEVIRRSNENMVNAQEFALNSSSLNRETHEELVSALAVQSSLENQNRRLHAELKEKEVEFNRILKRYQDLETQFGNVLTMSIDKESDIDEKKKDVAKQKEEILEEINQWREAFLEEEGRPPTEEDKAVVAEMFDRKRKIMNMEGALQIVEKKEIPENLKADQAQQKELEEYQSEKLVEATRDLKEELDQEEAEKERLTGVIKDLKSELSTIGRMKGGTKGKEEGSRMVISSAESTKLKRELELKQHEMELMAISHSEQLRAADRERDEAKAAANNQIDVARTELGVAKEACEKKVLRYKEESKELKEKVQALEKLVKSQTPEDMQEAINEVMQDLTKRQEESLASLKTITKLELEKSKAEADLDSIKASYRQLETETQKLKMSLASLSASKEAQVEDIREVIDIKFEKYKDEDFKTIESLETRVQELEDGAPVIVMQQEEELEMDDYSKRPPEELVKEIKKLHQVIIDKNKYIKELENNLQGKQAMLAAVRQGKPVDLDPKKMANISKGNEDKKFKDLNNKLNAAMLTLTKTRKELEQANRKLKELQSENNKVVKENEENKKELAKLSGKNKADVEALAKIADLEKEVISLKKENSRIAESYKAEHVLRKKYYNTIEDMKGKIRVYARSRPLSKTENEKRCKKILLSPDEYSLNVQAPRGIKEFQFDSVFTWDHSQDQVYEDTHNLIQSAVDGYNVCIFAYGQTGSGKTFTIVGAPDQPGIVPRAISDIYALMEENKNKFTFSVSCYMLELYNDQIIDLQADTVNPKMDIRKDAKGMVYVQGSVVKDARNR